MPPPKYDSFAFSVDPAPNARAPRQPPPPLLTAFSSDGTPVTEPRQRRQRAASAPWNSRQASQFRQTDPSSFQISSTRQLNQQTWEGGQRNAEFAFGVLGGRQGSDLENPRNAYASYANESSRAANFRFAMPYSHPLGQPGSLTEPSTPFNSVGDPFSSNPHPTNSPSVAPEDISTQTESSPMFFCASPAARSRCLSTSSGSTSVSWHSAQSNKHSPVSPLPSAGSAYFSPPSLSPLILSGSLPHDSPVASSSSLEHTDDDFSSYIPRIKKPKISKTGTAFKVLGLLDEAKLDVIDLLKFMLDNGDVNFESYRKALFMGKNQGRLGEVFTAILDDDKSVELGLERRLLLPRATKLVCEEVHREMEAAKPALTMVSTEVTADFIDNWDLDKIMGPVVEGITPTFSAVFEAAAESNCSKEKDKTARSKNRRKGMYILHAGVHFLRSLRSSKVQIGLGLAAWACGASKEVMMLLHHAGLSMSYSSINSIITALANSAIQKARTIASGPHGLAYDNVNVSTSIFVEQRPGMPSKVQSGTFAVIYELLNARPEDLDLKPIMDNFKKSLPMTLDDLQPTEVAAQSYGHQTAINICHILFKHIEGFENLIVHPLLQHPPRRMIPVGHKTKFFPVRATTIEEASIDGNLAVHDDVYKVQLGLNVDELSSKAIPSFNDQLTNARIRGAQDERRKDISAWERREIFQLAFGIFHLNLNLIWNVLSIHRGSIDQVGSLSYFFSILGKVRLGSDHPDYHTLLSALVQVLEGLILNAWRQECGDLSQFAASGPTPESLLQKAREITDKYTVPKRTFPASNPKHPLKDLDMDDRYSDGSSEEESECESVPSESIPDEDLPKFDTAYENVVLLTRDLLYVLELVNAVKTGDFGRVEDILPILACMFRGSGSNNYSTEILHLLHNIKSVWTPEFANIMRDNILVNVSGHPGHAMGIDLNIEHLIGYLKRLFSSKGIYSNWDRLGNISAAISHLNTIKRQVAKSTNAGYQSRSHKSADNGELVRQIADKVRDTGLQIWNTSRDNKKVKTVIDMQAVGYKKFESTALAAFNKKIEESKRSIRAEREVDQMPPVSITTDFSEGDEDLDGEEESQLHDNAD